MQISSSSLTLDNLDWSLIYRNSTDWTSQKIAYRSSKLSLILLAKQVNKLYHSEGLIGIAVDPGTILFTNIIQSVNVYGTLDLTFSEDLNDLFGIRLVKTGAAQPLYAAVNPNLKGGEYLCNCMECHQSKQNPLIHSLELQDALWKNSTTLLEKLNSLM